MKIGHRHKRMHEEYICVTGLPWGDSVISGFHAAVLSDQMHPHNLLLARDSQPWTFSIKHVQEESKYCSPFLHVIKYTH